MIIITEKPSVARKISEFLSKGKYKKIKFARNVYYYSFQRDNKNYYVLPSIGHLYNLYDFVRDFSYPSFSYRWVPTYISDGISISKVYIEMFRRFRNEKEIILATDYDVEGELIGYNILRFIFENYEAKRMVFSAITYKDITRAFENLSEINKGFVMAGETRHIVDWLFGINLSRALTKAINIYNKNIILSIGRVQGPTLKIIYEREKEIENFVPEIYYTLSYITNKDGYEIKFKHKDVFKDIEMAKIIKERLGNYDLVINIIKEKYNYEPPHPYNLTDIQEDAYRIYKIPPKKTLEILQRLYERGYISYPRTSSQRLPNTINFREIIQNLSSFSIYKKFAEKLINKYDLVPNNGKKDDIHPAIHPTGVIPDNLDKKEFLIYDLVVRRFFATFYDKAIIEKNKIITKEGFLFEYEKILYKGWIEIYWNIMKDNFYDLNFNINDKLYIKKIELKKNKTKPPPRYNQASLIRKMESLNIGTKSTRADIVAILFKRGYFIGKSIKITDLGKKVIDIFDKYLPDILDVKMTSDLEEKMNLLERKPDISLKEKIIEEAKEIVKNVCYEIKRNEKEIGRELYNSIIKGN